MKRNTFKRNISKRRKLKKMGGKPTSKEMKEMEESLKGMKRGFGGRKSLNCILSGYSSDAIKMFLESEKIDDNNYVEELVDGNDHTIYRLRVTPYVYRHFKEAIDGFKPQEIEETVDYRYSDFVKYSSSSFKKDHNCFDRIVSINELLLHLSINLNKHQGLAEEERITREEELRTFPRKNISSDDSLKQGAISVTPEMCLELDKNYSGDYVGFTSLFRKAFNCGVPFDKIRIQEKFIEDILSIKMGKLPLRKRENVYSYFWRNIHKIDGGMNRIEQIVENLKQYIREQYPESRPPKLGAMWKY